MKLIDATAINFASFSHININYDSLYLTLIHGPTGSGKSTLLDIPAWALFGETAKDLSVDDIKSWHNDDLPTNVVLTLELSDGDITVIRVRGSASENDLYWCEGNDPTKIRGKDIKETQVLLEKRLGFTKEAYLSSAYFHEFSPIGRFFTTKAKEQRELFEELADLTLPNNLMVSSSETLKQVKNTSQQEENLHSHHSGKLVSTRDMIYKVWKLKNEWSLKQRQSIKEALNRYRAQEDHKKQKIADTIVLYNRYELDKDKQLIQLTNFINDVEIKQKKLKEGKKQVHCDSCNQIIVNIDKHIKQHDKQLFQYKEQYTVLKQKINPYKDVLESLEKPLDPFDQLAVEQKRKNPFIEQLKSLIRDFRELTKTIDVLLKSINKQKHEILSLQQLYNISSQLRAELLRKTINNIENITNSYLEKYYDAELRIQLDFKKADAPKVTIFKSGYECKYQQLSKGQRCMLKLCFTVTIMDMVANKNGVHFDNLFFDEALDGLDSELKTKTFRLFEDLNQKYSSILVVDHSEELKNLFFNKIGVKLIGDISEIEYES